jgi:hypothetical protein
MSLVRQGANELEDGWLGDWILSSGVLAAARKRAAATWAKEDEGARAVDLTSRRFRLERRVPLRRIRSAPLIFDRTV